MLVNCPSYLFLVVHVSFSIGAHSLHDPLFIILENVSDLFENLVHVLIILILKATEGLFCFVLFSVVHFETAIVE